MSRIEELVAAYKVSKQPCRVFIDQQSLVRVWSDPTKGNVTAAMISNFGWKTGDKEDVMFVEVTKELLALLRCIRGKTDTEEGRKEMVEYWRGVAGWDEGMPPMT